MAKATTNLARRIIQRRDNVVAVDFRQPQPEPPDVFPGAAALDHPARLEPDDETVLAAKFCSNACRQKSYRQRANL